MDSDAQMKLRQADAEALLRAHPLLKVEEEPYGEVWPTVYAHLDGEEVCLARRFGGVWRVVNGFGGMVPASSDIATMLEALPLSLRPDLFLPRA